MSLFLYASALVSLGLSGAIFGFFYAWVCSTMWGLDTLDPRDAIRAMQAMNESVRNVVFMPAFFFTPLALGVTAAAAFVAGAPRAAIAFAAAAVVYLVGGMGLTLAVNVPMNEALEKTPVPETIEAAAVIWADYAPRWQVFNILRTALSGVALMLTGAGLLLLGRAGA
ncbi:MAG: anthrone oxygenase family protein [Pseudomonadota bacterium]